MQRPVGGGKPSDGRIIEETTLQLERGGFSLPPQLESFSKSLLDLSKKATTYGILQMAKKMSCRSSMGSLPAIFRNTDVNQFDLLSLQDLPRVQFDTITREALERQVVKIPWRMRFQNEFIEVNRIKQKQDKIRIAFEAGRFEEAPAPLGRFSVITEDHDLENKIFQMLKGQPAYLLFSKEDWRLPGFFTVHGVFLVIGGDAYLAWFLREGGIEKKDN